MRSRSGGDHCRRRHCRRICSVFPVRDLNVNIFGKGKRGVDRRPFLYVYQIQQIISE